MPYVSTQKNFATRACKELRSINGRQFERQFGMAEIEFICHSLDSGGQPEAGLDTNDQQIKGIGNHGSCQYRDGPDRQLCIAAERIRTGREAGRREFLH